MRVRASVSVKGEHIKSPTSTGALVSCRLGERAVSRHLWFAQVRFHAPPSSTAGLIVSHDHLSACFYSGRDLRLGLESPSGTQALAAPPWPHPGLHRDLCHDLCNVPPINMECTQRVVQNLELACSTFISICIGVFRVGYVTTSKQIFKHKISYFRGTRHIVDHIFVGFYITN